MEESTSTVKTTRPHTGALSGMTVLDMTRVLAGPTCTQILGDLGADILKIERPIHGDDSRAMGPPYADAHADNPQESAYFISVNRNKRSLALNLTQPQGQAIARQLMAKSDIVVENFRKGVTERWQLDYSTACRHHPHIIYCSLSGFGRTGPYADRGGYDFLIQAMGGLMSITGDVHGTPMKASGGLIDVLTGLYASTAILAALHHRQRTGQGQHIDMALFDTQIAYLGYIAQSYLMSKEMPQRYGNSHPTIVPYQLFHAQDEPIILAIGSDLQFQRFCHYAQCDALAQDKRFATNATRVQHRQELIGQLQHIIKQHNAQYWCEGLTQCHVPCSHIRAIPDVLKDPQAQARHMVRHMPYQPSGHAKQETLPFIASPMTMEKTPIQYRHPPPRCGEQSNAILKEYLGMTDKDITRLIEDGIVSSPSQKR
ncbi:MAG: CoA transferase [Alphaproteobacteria bacterium GM7ARS4]|nr:CoA transferase [Alphaproteobacteria bacterium GM7ARS4]